MLTRLVIPIALGVLLATATALGDVQVVRHGDGWRLLRNGEPYFIRGAGGDGPKDLLAASGGNSFRTWGVGPETPALLETARANGLTVALGFWLGHERHGFDYGDPASLAEQERKVRDGVLKYRSDPAVLMWVLGNEMEGYEEGDDPRIWTHIQDLADMVKSLDPTRPVMTVIAEVGGRRVQAIHELCPDVDIVGINSYAGAVSIPTRYREAGGTKPYVLTEFGPPGTWEVGPTAFGAIPEPTSTQKAETYATVWNTAIEAERDRLCLGGYAFTWGWKQEATATWFGMFLPDGSKLAPVDAMTFVWTGRWPANRCPTIEPIVSQQGDTVKPGERMNVAVAVADPEGDPVSVTWRVFEEADEYRVGGEAEQPTREIADAVMEADSGRAEIRMPEEAGVYRIYAFARDGQGGAAGANLPVHVTAGKGEDGSPVTAAPRLEGVLRVKLPLHLLTADPASAPFTPSGYMGGAAGIAMTPTAEGMLQVRYDGRGGWAGVVWQHPANDWGDQPGGYDLRGATSLTFLARGAAGGEKLKVGVGILGPDKPHFDTGRVEKTITLDRQWTRYRLDLSGQNLSRIKTGFMWVADAPVTFELKDITYE